MKTRTNRAELAALLGLLLGAAQAFAAPIEITIEDNLSVPPWGFTGDGVPGGGHLGIAKEDNETEPGSIRTQEWDMEAYVLDGSMLHIISGYDLLNGLPFGRPGDLFLKFGGGKPSFAPTTSTGNVTNALYDYTYAIDLSISAPTYTAVSFGPTVDVYALNAASTLNSVTNDHMLSNPWKYANNGTATDVGDIPVTYVSKTSAEILGLFGLTLHGTNHNVLSLDLSLLGVGPAQNVWLSYVMECGNDSLKGHIPDSGASALLLGLGLATLSVLGLRRRQVR